MQRDPPVAAVDEVLRRLAAAPQVVGHYVGQRGLREVAVDADDGRLACGRFQKGRVVARRGDQDAVDLARQERTDSLAFVAFVLRRVDQDDFVALRPRFVDDDAGDMGEIGVVDAGDQQTERVGTAGAQPFGQQAGRVVAAFGLARDERDGLLADTVFGGLSAQYAGDGRNRKAGALRDADEGLFRHRRVYFETKLEKYVKNRAAILFFTFRFYFCRTCTNVCVEAGRLFCGMMTAVVRTPDAERLNLKLY